MHRWPAFEVPWQPHSDQPCVIAPGRLRQQARVLARRDYWQRAPGIVARVPLGLTAWAAASVGRGRVRRSTTLSRNEFCGVGIAPHVCGWAQQETLLDELGCQFVSVRLFPDQRFGRRGCGLSKRWQVVGRCWWYCVRTGGWCSTKRMRGHGLRLSCAACRRLA